MSDTRRLEGKVAVITGAGSGIGRATSLLFADEGAKVVVADINPDTAVETTRMIKEQGGDATSIQTDVCHAADTESMIHTAVDTYGKLDILFNNAGIAGEAGAGLDSSSEEAWDRVMEVNLKGVFLGCKYGIPEMRRNGSGSIINTSSMGGIRATTRCPAYGVSKAGVILYTMSLALALAKDNIRVNCVCPGGTDTGLTPQFLQLPDDPELARQKCMAARAGYPLGRTADPKEIAYTVLFLASDESSFVTGTSLLVDGGVTAKLR